MTVWRAERAAQAWLNAGEVHVVAFPDEDLFYTESPEEQGLTQAEPQEYLVRVFTDRMDAARYHETVRDLYPEMRFIVRTFTDFEAMWGTLMGTHQTFKNTLGLPVRAVLCTMAPQEWPKNVDTVFSTLQVRN